MKSLTTLKAAVVVAAVMVAPVTPAWAGSQPGPRLAARAEASSWAPVLQGMKAGWEAVASFFVAPAPNLAASVAAMGETATPAVDCSDCGEPLPNAGVIVDPDG